jgi:hypothetical protein
MKPKPSGTNKRGFKIGQSLVYRRDGARENGRYVVLAVIRKHVVKFATELEARMTNHSNT